jgi:hypothetical protein
MEVEVIYQPPTALIEKLPDPQTVRKHLGQAIRDVKLLRQILRVSERADQHLRETKPTGREGVLNVR